MSVSKLVKKTCSAAGFIGPGDTPLVNLDQVLGFLDSFKPDAYWLNGQQCLELLSAGLQQCRQRLIDESKSLNDNVLENSQS